MLGWCSPNQEVPAVAEIVKPKDIAKILENIPENQIASAAEELGVKPEQLTKFVNKPTSKAFEKIAETLGEGLEGAQKFVDKFLQRGTEAVPPRPLALPPAAEEAAQALPAVVTPPGPLSPRMESIKSKAQKGVIDVEPISARPALPPGQAEVPPPAAMSQTPSQQAMEAATAPKPPQMSTAKKVSAAGLGAAVLGAGFSQEANPPPAVKEAQVDKVQDISTMVSKAVEQQAVTPEQQTVLESQAKQLEAAAQSLEQKLTSDYEKKKARVELMQLAETVMNGLVTAIGANALLNSGSPYAVDFSKGPKTDWNSEFDRLQKDYVTQLGSITQKYKLEAAEKRAAAKEAGVEARFQRQMDLRERALAAKQAQTEGTTAQKAADKKAKLEADAVGLIEKISAFDPAKDVAKMSTSRGQLYKVTQQLFSPEERKQLEARAAELSKENESKVRTFFRDIGLVSQEKTPKEYANLTNAYAQAVAEKLGGAPAAPEQAEAMVDMVAPDGRALKVPAARVSDLEAKGARRK